MRRAAKRDISEPAIVAALKVAGAFVWRLNQPVDLLVFYRGWHLLEVKSDAAVSHHRKPRKAQEDQTVFCKTFGVPIVRSADDALRAIGAIR